MCTPPTSLKVTEYLEHQDTRHEWPYNTLQLQSKRSLNYSFLLCPRILSVRLLHAFNNFQKLFLILYSFDKMGCHNPSPPLVYLMTSSSHLQYLALLLRWVAVTHFHPLFYSMTLLSYPQHNSIIIGWVAVTHPHLYPSSMTPLSHPQYDSIILGWVAMTYPHKPYYFAMTLWSHLWYHASLQIHITHLQCYRKKLSDLWSWITGNHSSPWNLVTLPSRITTPDYYPIWP